METDKLFMEHVVSTEANIRNMEAEVSFGKLSEQEKLYAYHFSQASWQGNKICYFQRSFESPALFYLFQKIFSRQSPQEVEDMLLAQSFTPLQVKQIMVYVAALFQNCGNYLSFGDKKFIPQLEQNKFVEFIRLTQAYQEESEKFDVILEETLGPAFSYQDPFGSIGLVDKQGLSGYYSGNMQEKEVEAVNAFMNSISQSPLNTRVMKDGDTYVILVASIEQREEEHFWEGNKFKVCYGDFSTQLKDVNNHLQECLEHCANQHQRDMISSYIAHFQSGDIELHRESQKHWIMDKGPIIETNLGFIEHYLDPTKVRAEWEGFVAIVDKDKSAVLSSLVARSEDFVARLPWERRFENDTFNSPDFTALDVVSFASSGTPIGINIPNYDDIREKFGFKNVDLQNAYGKTRKDQVQFLQEDLLDSYVQYQNMALFVIVALHELLGHGSGKLFQQDKDGGFNFENNGQDGYYKTSETFGGVFGDISSGYEECKADSVALFLSVYPDVMATLLPTQSEQTRQEVLRNVWLEMVLTGIKGLRCYDAPKKQWLQAHCQAAYAIVRVLQLHDPSMISITIQEDPLNMKISMDFSKIQQQGFQAISDFLRDLQMYKSTANAQQGTAFFEKYCKVDEQMLKVKEVVDANKKPRAIELQPSILLKDGQVQYVAHQESFQGVINSHLLHYHRNVDDVYQEWISKKHLFKYRP